jgi:DNA polymerase III sliding clamp (beta) subunit (PCNA family)
MSIIILTEELQQAVKLAQPFISKQRDYMRISNHSAVIVDNALTSGMERNFTFLYESSESVIVSVKDLKKAIAGHKAHTVTLQPFNNKVIVNDRVHINEYTHDSAVWFPESKPYEERIELNANNLQTAIKKVASFVSTETTAPILNCIHFTLNADEMELTATDRHRLARYAYNLDREHHLTLQRFNLPARYAELLTMVKSERSAIDLHVNYASHYSEFRIDNRIRIRIKHDESTYPDTTRILENSRGIKGWLTFDRSDMLATVKDLKRVTSEKVKLAIVKHDRERVYVSNGATAPTFQTTIDLLECNEDAFQVGFNAEYLLDSLQSFQNNNVSLCYTTRVQPLYLREETSTVCHEILILPFRLKELEEQPVTV